MSEQYFNDSEIGAEASDREASENGAFTENPATESVLNDNTEAEPAIVPENDEPEEADVADEADTAETSSSPDFEEVDAQPAPESFSQAQYEVPPQPPVQGQIPPAPPQYPQQPGYGYAPPQGVPEPTRDPAYDSRSGSYTSPAQPQRAPSSYNPYGAPSQGYFRPQTNEFVYSPEAPKKKKNFGKGLIIAIACVLSAFIVSILSISAYTYFSGGYSLRSPYADSHGDPIDPDERQKVDQDIHAFKNETDDEGGDSDDGIEQIIESEEESEDLAEAVSTPEKLRDFPTIEQLATPDDAMKLPDIYDKVSKSVVGVSATVRGGIQNGTGFIISEDGYVVTNAHVIKNYISVIIVDGDLNEYEATVIGSDEQTDIAVLKVNPGEIELVPVEFGKSDELRVGEIAVAIGNPLGFDLYGTMTTGIISGLDRTVTIGDNTMNLLQTSASINNGNSGGPLINAYGLVVGITSAKVSSIYGESLGFAIPIDEALPIVEDLIAYGYVPGRPSLGIISETVDDILSICYRIPKGAYVRFVMPGGSAEKAGIMAGDVIIGMEGESVEKPEDLNEIQNRYSVGDTVTLSVYRSGRSFDIDVVLMETTPENKG